MTGAHGRHWHDVLRDVGVFVACVVFAVTVFSTFLISRTADRNTSRIVAAIQKAQSPATQAVVSAATRAVLIQIQCGTRQAFVDIIHDLNPNVGIHIAATAGIPAVKAIPPTPGVPNSGVPAIPAIPGCPPINVP